MTVAEAARLLEVSPSTIYALCAGGLLGHHRVGARRGAIRIDPEDIESYRSGGRIEGGELPGKNTTHVPKARRPRVAIPDVFADMRAREKSRARKPTN